MATSRFEGFSPQLPRYLEELGRNNSKKWFDAHRADYEELYLEPAKRFVDALGTGLRKVYSGVDFEARVNRSIMRINRDTRFASDKTPYKTVLHLIFWEGAAPRQSPAFYFALGPGEMALAAGLFGFDKKQLERYRKAVLDARAGKTLDAAIRKGSARGSARLGGQHYKRVPRGFDAEHPRAELLKHTGLWLSYEERPAKELLGKSAVAYCVKRYRELRPVQKWLVENVA